MSNFAETLVAPPAAPTPSPESQASGFDQAQRAIEVLASRGLSGEKQPSNPSELAAAGGDASKTPTARQWSDADVQAAQAYLRRFGVPESFLDGATRDKTLELGLHLGETQKGITQAKARAEARISELEQLVTELSKAAARKAEPKVRNTEDSDRKAAIKEIAEELGGDASKLGPALERLIPKPAIQEPESDKPDKALEEVHGLAVESARTQLVGQFPGLQHGALYDEVLVAMQSLAGPRYDSLPLAQREMTRMRDAALLVLGPPSAAGAGPNQTQTRDQVLRSQVPTPQRGAPPKQPQTPVQRAQSILDAHGYTGR